MLITYMKITYSLVKRKLKYLVNQLMAFWERINGKDFKAKDNLYIFTTHILRMSNKKKKKKKKNLNTKKNKTKQKGKFVYLISAKSYSCVNKVNINDNLYS